VNAPEVIARQLGKEFLLDVADDLTVLPDGLKLHVRCRNRAIHVRMLSVDRFTVNGAWPPLYGCQLRSAVEGIVGPYDGIHAEVLEIFRDAQELAQLEAAWSWYETKRFVEGRNRREFDRQKRDFATRRMCDCGCGRNIPPTRNATSRRFATDQCSHRLREKLLAERRQEAAAKLCECGCGQHIPATHNAVWRRFASDKCRDRWHYAKRKRCT